MNRKSFLKKASLTTLATSLGLLSTAEVKKKNKPKHNPNSRPGFPAMISTWHFGIPANDAGMEAMKRGLTALDAIELAGNVIENDPQYTSVGIGGFPDRDGHLTLDACIMDSLGNAGSVSFLEGIANPISVARKVMEKTPHVMLVGEGARRFAIEQGFKTMSTPLTPKAKEAYEKWKIESKYQPVINWENHDTIGLLALDQNAKIAGGCTTSGMAFKMHGRVGDSPIIGAGLYLDPEVGGCTTSGLGEVVLKTLGSFLVVEFMRLGKTPQEATEEAIARLCKKMPNYDSFQVGYIAMDIKGNHGAFAIHKGFQYALYQNGTNKVYDSGFKVD